MRLRIYRLGNDQSSQDQIFEDGNLIGDVVMTEPKDVVGGIIQFLMKMRMMFGTKRITYSRHTTRSETQDDSEVLEQVKAYNDMIWHSIRRFISDYACGKMFSEYFRHRRNAAYDSVFVRVDLNYDSFTMFEKIQVSMWTKNRYTAEPIVNSMDYAFSIGK